MTSLPVRNPALSIIATLSLIVLLRYAQDLFAPIVLSILIAYATNPLVNAIQWLHIPRTIAALLVVLGLAFGFGLGAYLLRQQAIVVVESLPEAAAKVRRKIEE